MAHDEMQRGAFLRARFGEKQTSLRKIEGGMGALSRDRDAALLPVEASGDHEMQDEEALRLELENEPLAHPTDAEDRAAFERGRCRGHGFEQRWALDPNLLEGLAADV
jgi:hypothetical protein